VDLEKRNYDSGIDLLTQIVDQAFDSAAAPEALYLLGAGKYRKSGDFQQAVDQWRRLKLSFPDHPLIKKIDYAL
jgi:cytochrome c-type biogenesis protein CcmH/NrfG